MVLERSLQFPVFSLSPRPTSSNSTGVSLRIFQPGQPKSEASERVGVPEEAAEGWAPWAEEVMGWSLTEGPPPANQGRGPFLRGRSGVSPRPWAVFWEACLFTMRTSLDPSCQVRPSLAPSHVRGGQAIHDLCTPES